MAGDAVRGHVLVGRDEVRGVGRRPPRAGHAGLGVHDDVGRDDAIVIVLVRGEGPARNRRANGNRRRAVADRLIPEKTSGMSVVGLIQIDFGNYGDF